MHRDQKIGLSLAVLIIGFAAAFCFRSEPTADPQSLALEVSADIDARIEQLPVRAYTSRDGVTATSAAAVAGDAQQSIAAMIERPLLPPHPLNDASDGDLLDLFAGPPEPVLPPVNETEPDIIEPPLPESDVVLDGDGGTAANVMILPNDVQKPAATPATPVAVVSRTAQTRPTRTYVVTSGDTLSGIAFKMYGESRRYLDLYRANTDVLSDPDDLPVGTTLVVPE